MRLSAQLGINQKTPLSLLKYNDFYTLVASLELIFNYYDYPVEVVMRPHNSITIMKGRTEVATVYTSSLKEQMCLAYEDHFDTVYSRVLYNLDAIIKHCITYET